MIKLGDRVRDVVTGMQGIATGRTEYLNGCVHICISPPLDREGKKVEGGWIDLAQVEVLEAGAFKPQNHNVTAVSRPGGPSSNPPPVR